ncbi:MAG: leucine-rich repeat domain-containing protein [Alphaproteobacteria bacterium]|nr:leucine-rich repeat domain-containing protein [Alphaproteobacteria bacterium]
MKKLIFLLIWMFGINLTINGAHADIIAQGDDCGEDCHWEINDEGLLNITGSGAIKDYTRVNCDTECTTSAPWKSYVSQVTSLNIGKGITSIGYDAFEDMLYIRQANLPDGLESIGALAFHSCSSLQNLVLPSTVKEIGSWGISHTGIKSLVLSEDLESAGSYSFGGNSHLKALIIPENLESLDVNVFAGVAAYGKTGIKELYCSAKQMDMCRAAAEKLGITPILYTKTSDGSYIVDNMRYGTLGCIGEKKGVRMKRIYTLDEAEKVSKKTGNTFRIRYK